MNDLRLRFAIAGAMTVALLSIASPSNADTLTGRDERKDLIWYDASGGWEEAFPGTPKPSRRDGDLTGYKVRHGQKRIFVSMRYRDLKRTAPALVVMARFRFPRPNVDFLEFFYDELVVTAVKGDRRGSSISSAGRCKVRHRINYEKNFVRMSVARTCFSTPKWVQFNATTLAMDKVDEPTYFYEDHVYRVMADPRDETPRTERYTARIRAS